MSQRAQFVKTVSAVMAADERATLLLGDIGVFGFREAFQRHAERAFNIGILEQSTIGLAAGLATTGLIPIVHTIAPFLVERSLEQLKVDFGYQRLGGNFVSVGGSYDYAALGCTHHCPGDVGQLRNVPRMEIVVPGADGELDVLFREAWADGQPTYFRLSERGHAQARPVRFGRAHVEQVGAAATVVVIGPLLDAVLEAARGLDVTILYYTTVAPFDAETLRAHCPSGKVLLCEPYYQGTLADEVCRALRPRPVALETAGVPRAFLDDYGHAADHDLALGLVAPALRVRLQELIDG